MARGLNGQDEGRSSGLVGDLIDGHHVVLPHAMVKSYHPSAQLLDLLPKDGAAVLWVLDERLQRFIGVGNLRHVERHLAPLYSSLRTNFVPPTPRVKLRFLYPLPHDNPDEPYTRTRTFENSQQMDF